MEPFRFHLFVCTQSKPEGVPSCAANGSLPLLPILEAELLAKGLDPEVQLTTCGCLGLCDEGPILMVYPGPTYYRKLGPSDIPEIVSSHLRNNQPVARLAWNDSAAMKATASEHRQHFRAMLQARDRAGILPDDLNDTIRGFMPARAILTALELDLFTAVANGASAAHLANKLHTHPRATEMLLNVLVSLNLLEKQNSTFHNTSVSSRFFTTGSHDNARPALLHTSNLWRTWSTLTEAVRAGTSVATRTRNADSVISFIAAMDRNARERAAAVVQGVSAPPNLRRMLDLGGGSGAYSIAFVRATPTLHAEILDLPEVIPLTQEHIRKARLTDRISTRAGDMLTAPIGENFDLILISAICHMFSPEENRSLLHRAAQALAPGGLLVVQDFILNSNKTAPQFAALFSLNMLVGTRAGSSYSEPEYSAWLREAHLSNIRHVPLPGPASLMVATR
jgi:(2Fe-2S) ferredoxin/predicted O-methyltransferase YrrM